MSQTRTKRTILDSVKVDTIKPGDARAIAAAIKQARKTAERGRAAKAEASGPARSSKKK